jgi:hypothetical protein
MAVSVEYDIVPDYDRLLDIMRPPPSAKPEACYSRTCAVRRGPRPHDAAPRNS